MQERFEDLRRQLAQALQQVESLQQQLALMRVEAEQLQRELAAAARPRRGPPAKAAPQAAPAAPRSRGHPGKAQRNDHLLALYEQAPASLRPSDRYRHVARILVAEQERAGDEHARLMNVSTVRSAIGEAKRRRAAGT